MVYEGLHGPFCMAMVTLMNTVCIMLIDYRYWSVELERKKKGHVPRLWFAWFKCFWMRIVFQGFVLLSLVSSS